MEMPKLYTVGDSGAIAYLATEAKDQKIHIRYYTSNAQRGSKAIDSFALTNRGQSCFGM